MVLAFSTSLIVGFAAFACVSILAWVGMQLFLSSNEMFDKRLKFLSSDSKKRNGDAPAATRTEELARMLEKAAPALSEPLKPTNEKEMSKLRQQLVEAGFRREEAPMLFLAIKVIFALTLFIVGGGGVVLVKGVNQSSSIWLVCLAAAGLMLPGMVLGYLAKARKTQIFRGLPDALDLMVVCVEAGLGLDQAMRKVAEEMKKSFPVIAEEFGLCNLHLQMGRPRTQVLQELGSRSGVEDLRALASIMIQADKFGSSISQALRTQSDTMRVKRQQIAEEKAAKTAVKLIFPLVLFIFPGIFVVLVGPAGIQMSRDMFPLMTGEAQ